MKRRVIFGGSIVILAALLAGDAPRRNRTPLAISELAELLRRGAFVEVEERTAHLLPLVEAELGPDSLEVALIIDARLEAQWHRGRPLGDPERRLAERAVAAKEARLGPHHVELATSLINLGVAARDAAEHELATELFERALQIREASLGADDPEVATTLSHLGWTRYLQGDLERAAASFERALAIREFALGQEHERVAAILNNLAIVLQARGDYTRARASYERAIRILTRSPDTEPLHLASSTSNLAALLRRQGAYVEARALLERNLARLERHYGDDDVRLVATLKNLANVERDLGAIEPAQRLTARALGISRKQRGEEHVETASLWNNLGWLARERGDLAEAETMLGRALVIRERALPATHRDIAQSLSNLGALQLAAGRPSDAARYLARALAINEAALGNEHAEVARTVRALAEALAETGDLFAARQHAERALALFGEGLGPDHPDVAVTLRDLSWILLGLRDSEASLTRALEADSIGREHLRLTARMLPEEPALRYASVRPVGLDLALSVVIDGLADDPRAVRRTWDALTRSQALVLAELRSRRRARAETPGAAESLMAASERLANLLLRGPTDESPQRYRHLVESARAARDRAEQALALAGRSDRSLDDSAGLTEAAHGLPPRVALVCYVLYDHHRSPERRIESRYAAFVLPADAGSAILVPLGSATAIDARIDTWQAAIESVRTGLPGLGTAAERRYAESTGALRAAIWDPIAPHVGTPAGLFFVLDGALHRVHLGTLPTEDGRYLIETLPPIHYLNAVRDLARGPDARVRGAGLLALGAAEFGPATTESLIANPCLGDAPFRFAPLPGTIREVREVVDLWTAQAPVRERSSAVALVGPDATKTALVRSAPGRRVLHLATHGFALEDRCAGTAGTLGNGELRSLSRMGYGVTSGLALAFANQSNRSAHQEGLLSAAEVSALDLGGIEWVVLSACDSGLGAVQAGEGILGLRRAFDMAGARTLIVSLWALDDSSAVPLIRELYAARLSGLASHEAVAEASRRVLERRRLRGVSAHPFYWGPFVSIGDWR